MRGETGLPYEAHRVDFPFVLRSLGHLVAKLAVARGLDIRTLATIEGQA
jgi:hypothetical protein